MSSSDNIMPFKQADLKQQVLYKKLYSQCEELTLKHLKAILQKMFDHADDTLFALAEKTDATTDSTAYFDSMRIVRLKRNEIESQHFSYIKQAFEDLKNDKATTQQNSNELDSLSMDDLSLIEDADLEENIAIKNIVSKVSHHCSLDLSHIEKRLSHILNTDVSAQNNPVGPEVICNTFMQAAATLDIELKVSLIILKLFEHEIITGISPLLHEANNIFIQANVLPEFKRTVQKSEHVDSPYSESPEQQEEIQNNPDNNAGGNYSSGITAGQNANNNATTMSTAGVPAPGSMPGAIPGMQSASPGHPSAQDTSIAHFHQLLSQQHAHSFTGTGTQGMNTAMPGSGIQSQSSNVHPLHPSMPGTHSANPGSTMSDAGISGAATSGQFTISTPQFVGSLTQLQNNPDILTEQTISVSEDDDGEQIELSSVQSTSNLKQYVIQQLEQQDENFSINNINPLDQDVIDVVSMLFEFILEDKNIPDAAKAYIARLQIPLLKAAIIDKEFFSTGKNSARTLLNELAHAALGIIDEADSASQKLLDEIARVVDTINDEFEDDLGLFERLLTEFREFIEQHDVQEKNISHRIEKKIKQKEDNALAYQWVEDTIDDILKEKHLPEVILELINGPWKRVMLNTYLNNGQNSDTWKNQVRFIDVLEWSIQPKHESVDRQKLANIIGQLVMTLRNGLQVIQVSEDETQQIMSQLEPFHLASIKGISVKEHLASLTPHEAFLFGSEQTESTVDTSEDLNTENDESPQYERYDDVANETESIPVLVEEIDYQADENYESDLSLEEIDQTIQKMEQELTSLEELAATIGVEAEQNEQSIDSLSEADPISTMEDDFVLLGDGETADENSFNKLITEDIIMTGYSTTDDSPEDQPEDEYLELARHLEQGKWVEFLDDNKQKTRAKLAWKSDLLGEYTFLNWKFDVVADKTLYGLAADLRRGTATIIDDIPLVDRALSAVMSSLTPSGEAGQSGGK